MNTEKFESEEAFLEGLQLDHDKAYRHLYDQAYKSVEYMVLANNGNQEDARDLFQEAVIALMKMIRKDGFALSAKISTITYSISRNLWLKRIRNRKGKEFQLIEDDQIDRVSISEDDSEEKVQLEKKHEMVAEELKNLGEICKKIILLFYYKKVPQEIIAKEMGYTKGYIRIRMFRCMNKLRKNVLANLDA